ncbi:hypothetical protein CC78DRAFT_619046 [Lojkania enalia]|uniref:Uncharacterized protein n=1 Tax=Lojkania enalia TaxID=147567 RepID=A0A9P4N7E6_9PLEO|nr:hypothetical protein CC78DRAFT_619046 [Didymosphaeria enalia]
MGWDMVYTGIWKNWNDEKQVSGLTLTMSPSHGPLLIAFLALFVSVASSHLWHILCFTLHQSISTSSLRDGLHHQIQALLRNNSSIYLGIPAIAHVTLMTIASIFSARILSSGDEVLVRGSSCGWMDQINEGLSDMNQTELQDKTAGIFNMGRWTAMKALDYAQTCYGSINFTQSSACKFYATTAINITANSNVPCPFGEKLCGLYHGIKVDTGLVDSNLHLGINSKPSGRIQVRKVLTCIPTTAEEHYSGPWQNSDLSVIPGDNFKTYYLGRNPGLYESNASFVFSPISELRVANSDIVLLNIQSIVGYTSEVLDPWFRATSTNDSSKTGSSDNYVFPPSPYGTKISYYPDRIVSVLGCTEQYQFCNNTNCSELDGLYANRSSPYLGLTFNDEQKAIFRLLWNAVFGVTINYGTFFFGDQLLLAREKLLSAQLAISAPLPSNQWELEVTNIVKVMLAALQRRVVDYASPPDIPLQMSTGRVSSLSLIEPPKADADKQICGIIRVRNAAYFNFSLVGLLAVFIVAISIISINLFCLPGVAFWVQQKLRRDLHLQREWTEGHLLRLLRTAFESHGAGPWVTDGEIPVTEVPGLRFSADQVWEVKIDTAENQGTDTETVGRIVNVEEQTK